MSGLLRTVARRAAPSLRGHTLSQRANLYNAPAKEKLGALEHGIALSMFTLAILGPAGWVLANLESYRKKE